MVTKAPSRLTPLDWRTLPAERVAPLYTAEIERWGSALEWETAKRLGRGRKGPPVGHRRGRRCHQRGWRDRRLVLLHRPQAGPADRIVHRVFRRRRASHARRRASRRDPFGRRHRDAVCVRRRAESCRSAPVARSDRRSLLVSRPRTSARGAAASYRTSENGVSTMCRRRPSSWAARTRVAMSPGRSRRAAWPKSGPTTCNS